MNLAVGKTLSLNIFLDDLFVAVLAYGVRIVSDSPKLPAPEQFLHLGVELKDFFRGNAFYDLNDYVRRKHRDTLNKKVHMVLICANLYETYLKSFLYTQTYFFKRLLYFLSEYLSSVLCRAYEVVKKQRFVVPLEDMFAHTAILPRSRASRNYLIKLSNS